ncbi:hypothetical protein [Marinimicrobium sp. ARAG 43.8]|uniref:hypothetical protein n=1 Tax=Marinimicrobium sp. ARAG 43.8 TaxID=3418719 RepID=UPI003CE721D4
MKKILMTFGAGALGGLGKCLVMWLFGLYGISQMLGVSIAPGLSAHWLYPHIVWGGLWGFLFLLPVLHGRLLPQTLVLSLFPTLVQLFVIYPYQTRYGIAGLGLGTLTPVLVWFFNWVWALVAAIALRMAR